MTTSNELWVSRNNIQETRAEQLELGPIADGQVLLEIERFALTANNVTYAVTGDTLGYWNYYPVDDDWGRVPAWGFARVTESRCENLKLGERLWGFFPMSSHAVLTPGRVSETTVKDASPHRKALPVTYNEYARVDAEPAHFAGMDNERCLLYPLYGTAFLIYDQLVDNAFYGAKQVIIGSASSKTASGLAFMLKNNDTGPVECIGLTSEANVNAVKSLACYDRVLSYQDLASIDADCQSAYVDMSGNAEVLVGLHEHLRDNMKKSFRVGVTHWQASGPDKSLPGAKPEFFFAPSQIEKRNKDWGKGVVQQLGMKASAEAARALGKSLSIQWINDAEELSKTWCDLVQNKVPPSQGLMVNLS